MALPRPEVHHGQRRRRGHSPTAFKASASPHAPAWPSRRQLRSLRCRWLLAEVLGDVHVRAPVALADPDSEPNDTELWCEDVLPVARALHPAVDGLPGEFIVRRVVVGYVPRHLS